MKYDKWQQHVSISTHNQQKIYLDLLFRIYNETVCFIIHTFDIPFFSSQLYIYLYLSVYLTVLTLYIFILASVLFVFQQFSCSTREQIPNDLLLVDTFDKRSESLWPSSFVIVITIDFNKVYTIVFNALDETRKRKGGRKING